MIETSAFSVGEIPKLNPVLDRMEYHSYWSSFKKKIFEGSWVGGKWMPGSLFLMQNAWTIALEDKATGSKKLGKPLIRDLEWDKHYNLMEALGFSGFSNDTKYTCNHYYGPLKEFGIKYRYITQKEADSRIYQTPREYLRKIHSGDLGYPLYQNEARNVIDLESRETGKSYNAAAWIHWMLITAGSNNYDSYLENLKNNKPSVTEVLVGAIDAKYSSDLLNKWLLGRKHLAGSYEFNGRMWLSPLDFGSEGSLKSGQMTLVTDLSTKLHHRTFLDNPTAGNGTRDRLVLLEEVGFMNNIEAVLGAMNDSIAQDNRQFGSVYMFGTGGFVNGKAVTHLEAIFRNPEDYKCLVFEDTWEKKGKIGYFVPATKAMNQFKEGPNLITNDDLAQEFIEERRAKLKNSSKELYISDIINRPIIPSEIFYASDGGFFPSMEIKDHQTYLLQNPKIINSIWCGRFSRNFNTGNVEFREYDDALPIRKYNIGKNQNKLGCVEIFEHPTSFTGEQIPFNKYIAGIDTFDKDNAPAGSLGSIIIMNRYTGKLAATYVGRPETSAQFYDICIMMLEYYNGTAMYEKNLTGLYTHFSRDRKLKYLAETPKEFRESETYKEGTNTSKGINASGRTNANGRNFLKNWLLEKIDEKGLLRLQTIKSLRLLEELLFWNKDGNFDMVSAMVMLMWHDITLYKALTKDKSKTNVKDFSQHDYFKKMGLLKQNVNKSLNN